jgi:hypothetical protein
MLEALKHLLYIDGRMYRPHRRLIARRCAVCDWTGESIETDGSDADCPLCFAPTIITREEWLLDPVESRARAAAFGRLGGLKGGRIRAKRLSATRRRDIARKAAVERWRRR